MSHELQQLRARVDQLAVELAELRQTRRERLVAWVRRSRRTLSALVLCFVVVPVAVSAFTTPNTFTAGTPAVASQINDNFAAIKTRFDDMENKSWRLISETEVGASTNQVDITGLNGDSDLQYQVRIRIISGSNGGYYALQPNADITAGNYSLKGWSGNAHNDTVVISTTALAVAGVYVGYTSGVGQQSLSETSLFSKSGNARLFYTQRVNAVSATDVTDSIGATYTVWKNTATNITSFRLVSQNINGIGVGSHIEVWARR